MESSSSLIRSGMLPAATDRHGSRSTCDLPPATEQSAAAYLAAQRLGLIGVLVSSMAQNGIDQMKSAETAPGTSWTGTCGSAAGAHGPPILVVQYHSPWIGPSG